VREHAKVLHQLRRDFFFLCHDWRSASGFHATEGGEIMNRAFV